MKTFRCLFCFGNFIVRQAEEEIEDHKDRLKLHNGKRPKSEVRDSRLILGINCQRGYRWINGIRHNELKTC